MVEYLEKISGVAEEKPLIELPALITIGIIFISICLGLSILFLPWYISLFLFIGLCLGVAIFFNLYVGILIFLIGAFFHPTYWFPQLQAFHPARNLAFVVLFIWGFHTIVYRDFKIVKAPQNIIIITFLCLAFATTFKFFDYSFPFFIEFWSKAVILYFAISNLIKTRTKTTFLIWFLVGITLISAFIGIYQYAHNIGVYYAKEGILRIRGLAEDPNFYAMELAISLPLAIGLFFHYRSALVKSFIGAIIIILVFTIILTYSRAGMLQLMAVFFFSVGIRSFRRKKFITIFTFVTLLLLFIPFIPSKYWERAQTITNLRDPAIGKRIAGWTTGMEMMSEHPLTGVGFGMFRYVFFEKALISEKIPYKEPLDAHNIYIHTGAEVGLMGLLLLLFLIFWTFKYLNEARKIFIKKRDVLLSEITSSLKTAFIVYLLGGLFISYLQMLIFWIIVALAVVLRRLSLEE